MTQVVHKSAAESADHLAWAATRLLAGERADIALRELEIALEAHERRKLSESEEQKK